MKKTHNCGELRKENDDNKVILSGWVHKYRNLGGLLFIDLRDRYGITQIIFDPAIVSKEIMEISARIRNEFVITISGKVQVKPQPNRKLATGDIEILADDLKIENTSLTPPFNFKNGSSDTNREELRLEYRYLDLRSERMTRNLVVRNKVLQTTRNYLSDLGYLEIETPYFSKSTPEGARDYLVPTRLDNGMFYALPQSPQIYKQLLMVSGFDKYFQIARCFRDEDSRKDRQPEFTQIDIEKSFTDSDEIFAMTEEMMKQIFKNALNVDIPVNFERITYADSMERFGVDKPDLRFGMELKNITASSKDSEFQVFKNAEAVKFLAVPGMNTLSRKGIKVYENYSIHLGGKGLAFVKYIDGSLEGGISKFLSDTEKNGIIEKSGLGKNDGIIFFVADKLSMANKILGALRNRFAEEMDLYKKDEFKFCWITDFPMFEFNEEEDRWQAMHHMFTMPKEEFVSKLDDESLNPGELLSESYDLVLNGVELASGSIRIHKQEIQEKIFKILGLGEEEIEEKFGFMLKAFKYGAPPHGGIAPGLDRLVQMMCGEDTIREVIAFPKSQSQTCLMMNAPSMVDEGQLDELGLKIK